MLKLNTAVTALCALLIICCSSVYVQEIVYVSPREVVASASDTLQLSTSPHNVINKDRNSRWTSADVDNPQWIELGFPHEIDFSGIIIKWFRQYPGEKCSDIFAMDGEVWTEVDYSKETLSLVISINSHSPIKSAAFTHCHGGSRRPGLFHQFCGDSRY